jgi:hypothetical protein
MQLAIAAAAIFTGAVLVLTAIRGGSIDRLAVGRFAIAPSTPVNMSSALLRVPIGVLGAALLVVGALIGWNRGVAQTGSVTGQATGPAVETPASGPSSAVVFPPASEPIQIAGFESVPKWSDTQDGQPLKESDASRITRVDEKTIEIALLRPNTKDAINVVPIAQDFVANVIAEVTGPELAIACIAFRTDPPGHPQPKAGYSFCLSPSGQWAVAKWRDGHPVDLLPYRRSQDIHRDVNTLAAAMKRDQLKVFANEVQLADAFDPSFIGGAIDLVCGSPPGTDEAATCRFSEFGAEVTEPLGAAATSTPTSGG